jgi:F-type H+-transporting ATPase subunit b
MQSDIVHQLGELFLQAVPTVLIVLAFFVIMRVVFFRPLLKVMEERETRTRGAQKAAEEAQASAGEKSKQYQEALQQARAKIYAMQEASRKKLMDEHALRIKEHRAQAAAQVSAAKERAAAELNAAQREIAGTIGLLSNEIARHVLQSPRLPRAPINEAQ